MKSLIKKFILIIPITIVKIEEKTLTINAIMLNLRDDTFSLDCSLKKFIKTTKNLLFI